MNSHDPAVLELKEFLERSPKQRPPASAVEDGEEFAAESSDEPAPIGDDPDGEDADAAPAPVADGPEDSDVEMLLESSSVSPEEEAPQEPEDPALAKRKAYWQRFVVPKFGKQPQTDGPQPSGSSSADADTVEPGKEEDDCFSQQVDDLLASQSSGVDPRWHGTERWTEVRNGLTYTCIPSGYKECQGCSKCLNVSLPPTPDIEAHWAELFSEAGAMSDVAERGSESDSVIGQHVEF